jgi:23S rRNA (adenine2503-C2)-methyltransferase
MPCSAAEKERNLKFAVPLADGLVVEAVFYGSGTLCISSQGGCALGCPFCASGRKGFFRNLSPAEMVSQLAEASRRGYGFRRVTLSGIGEPLLNWENVRAFFAYCRKQGHPLSVTTVGRPLEHLRELLDMDHNGVMISLHGGTAATHSRLVPGGPDFNRLWTLLEECRPHLPHRRRRRVGVNYLLLEGLNDSPGEIEHLALRMKSFPEATLHLLECNPVEDLPFRSPGAAARQRIFDYLAARLPNVRRGNRWRRLAEGGCGTLLAAPPRF